ncbi:hypothetical protein [Streptomyces rhizosphaericus]|uniref:hypothetical protein n=1 Tax=Streptomyces rhizosphaericus TaxID=114699 RepID=UPI000A3A1E43|nr:hypothetical protein [Streptomyces rhizosphaericus]
MTTLSVNYGTSIDWGNPGFVEIYSYAFGVSAILTIILWLGAVAKRAAQGVHFGQAFGESIGYLLMSFMVSAFAPAAVAYTVKIMDGAAEAMLNSQTTKVTALAAIIVTTLLALLSTGVGAPLSLIIGFALILILLGIWILLIVRNALILCGLVFGPTVFSGLVNKDLWAHTKKWAGVMVAIIAMKYVIYTVLALAIALTAGLPRNVTNLSFGQALSTLIIILALFLLALFAPFQIAQFVPVFGDQLQSALSARGNFIDQAKSVYGQGKPIYDSLKGSDNPRLNGNGGAPSPSSAQGDADAAQTAPDTSAGPGLRDRARGTEDDPQDAIGEDPGASDPDHAVGQPEGMDRDRDAPGAPPSSTSDPSPREFATTESPPAPPTAPGTPHGAAPTPLPEPDTDTDTDEGRE